MLKWIVKNGDDKLRENIQETKDNFDKWFNLYWIKRMTKEQMLSENSPVPHVYYRMTKTFEEVKNKYPLDAQEKCSCCDRYVDKWLETSFSFCDEYKCGMSLCFECAEHLHDLIVKIK
ncbi:MAG: hypothetical protein Q8936_23870 [Bacillota bacterium]|nr:hypothetical protein [Bacillota bacterium]